jgi:hypothetical protein
MAFCAFAAKAPLIAVMRDQKDTIGVVIYCRGRPRQSDESLHYPSHAKDESLPHEAKI